MFENRRQPLLPPPRFYRRLARNAVIGSSVVMVSLLIGMVGYHEFEKLSWLDAFLNASMILSGMGPVSPIQTAAGKVFAGCYALLSGVAFIGIAGVVFAPVFHRFLHKFHVEEDSKNKR